MKLKLTSFVAAALCGALASVAHAEWPERPIQFISPYPAGGTADQIARRAAESMSKTLGQQVIVLNKPGGSTNIGAGLVANAQPDGYTIFAAGSTPTTLNPLLFKKLPFDPKRLKVIGNIVEAPIVIMANNALPVSNLSELGKYAKAHPGTLNYSSASLVGPLTLAVERIKTRMGIDMKTIAYSGGGPALMAVMAGDVQVGTDASTTAVQQVLAGKVKALAVTSSTRLKQIPNVPTVDEQVPGFGSSTVWYGVAVPAATPPAIVARLHEAVNAVIDDPQIRQIFLEQALIPQPRRTPAEIDAFLEADRTGWASVIKANNLSVD